MSESPDTEYTPTTAEIIRAYSLPLTQTSPRLPDESFAEWLGRGSIETHIWKLASEQSARRWLAAHDAGVTAKALDDAVAAWETEEFYADGAASYFRARAARIREGQKDA